MKKLIIYALICLPITIHAADNFQQQWQANEAAARAKGDTEKANFIRDNGLKIEETFRSMEQSARKTKREFALAGGIPPDQIDANGEVKPAYWEQRKKELERMEAENQAFSDQTLRKIAEIRNSSSGGGGGGSADLMIFGIIVFGLYLTYELVTRVVDGICGPGAEDIPQPEQQNSQRKKAGNFK